MKVTDRKVMELTRTNLRTLLNKLNNNPPNSACMIGGHPDADGWYVKAVEDAEHYSTRPRGEMHPLTEAAPEPTLDEGPDDGHTFRLLITSRMSSKVVGDEHHSDSDHFGTALAVEVRAWDLPTALRKAAEMPLGQWGQIDL